MVWHGLAELERQVDLARGGVGVRRLIKVIGGRRGRALVAAGATWSSIRCLPLALGLPFDVRRRIAELETRRARVASGARVPRALVVP